MAGDSSNRFPRAARVRRKAEFDGLLRRGVRVSDARLALWGAPNELDRTRLGLMVGRRHGNAPHRNRLKRLIREAFRLSGAGLPRGLDLLCSPHVGARLSLDGVLESLRDLALKLDRRLEQRRPDAADRGD